MDSVKRSTLTFIVISFLAAFVLLIASFYIYHSGRMDAGSISVGSLKNALIFTRALSGSLSLLPPAVIFIFVICFSLFFTLSPFRKKPFPFNSLAAPSFAMLIFFIIIITLSEFIFIPLLGRRTQAISHTSLIADAALVHARELYGKGDHENVLKTLDFYLKIDEKNREAQKLYTGALDGLSLKRLAETEEAFKSDEGSLQERPSFYERGREEYEKENYYAALFYLERARSLHRDNEEIGELYERSRRKAHDQLGEITEKERETKFLIEQKQRALIALDSGDFYEAYRIFSSLRQRYPNLDDLSLYLATVEEKLMEVDFLPSELGEYEWLPPARDIVFIDKSGFVNTIEKVIPYGKTFYFYGITRYRAESEKDKRVRAKYGKWMNGRILIKNAEGFKEVPEDEGELYNIYPFVNPVYLLQMDRGIENRLTLYERISLSEQLQRSGFDIEKRLEWLSRKIGILFSVYILSLFLGGFGWKRRSTYEFPSVIKLVIFAVVSPFVVYLLFLLYNGTNDVFIYSYQYFTRFVTGKINLLVYTILINSVIGIFTTLYFLSRKSSEEERGTKDYS